MTGSCLIGWDLRKHAPGSWSWIPERRPLLPGALAHTINGHRQEIESTSARTDAIIDPAIPITLDNASMLGSPPRCECERNCDRDREG